MHFILKLQKSLYPDFKTVSILLLLLLQNLYSAQIQACSSRRRYLYA